MNNEEVEKNHRSRGGSGWKIWRRKRWEEEGEGAGGGSGD